MALDADPEVVGVAAQPMWLHWTSDSGRPVRHAPDFFARRADGTAVVIDVRADERIGEKDAAVFAATARCAPRWGGSISGPGSWARCGRPTCAGCRVTVIPGSLSRGWLPGLGRCSLNRARCWAGQPRPGIRWRCCRCCSGCCGGASWPRSLEAGLLGAATLVHARGAGGRAARQRGCEAGRVSGRGLPVLATGRRGPPRRADLPGGRAGWVFGAAG